MTAASRPRLPDPTPLGDGCPARIHGAASRARERDAARRARVLAHAELREALTHPPLSYDRPEQWNGYIPPRLLPDDRPYGSAEPESARVNDSPCRAALVALCEQAPDGGRE